LERKSLARRVRELILDVDPTLILKDLANHGLQVESIEQIAEKPKGYPIIANLSQKYATTAALYCAVSGATSGVGGIATTVTLAGVDVLHMAAQLYRLSQRLAVLHGFDPTNISHQERSLLVYLEALGIDTAANGAIRTLVTAAAKESVGKKGPAKTAAIRLIMTAVKVLGASITKASAAKMVPFVGAAPGGGINYWFAKRAGKRMMLDFKSDYFDRQQGRD
jgi:hypothetical protein